MALRFKCPDCGGTVLAEVMLGVIQVSPIDEVYASKGCPDVEVEYDVENVCSEGGEIDRFQCVECGWRIKRAGRPITSYTGLAEWLFAHDMLDEEEHPWGPVARIELEDDSTRAGFAVLCGNCREGP
jgi:predicted RNA-binding Zn-ribbon protein involved in translation (DUF1610 family)